MGNVLVWADRLRCRDRLRVLASPGWLSGPLPAATLRRLTEALRGQPCRGRRARARRAGGSRVLPAMRVAGAGEEISPVYRDLHTTERDQAELVLSR